MNIETARANMIKQQIRACEVLDDKVLDVLTHTPREVFVGEAYQELAFTEMHIPIGHEQVMMTPLEEGAMVQSLNIHETDAILEIGTGSGYVTALLAKLGKYVYSIDIQNEFSQKAKKRLTSLGLHNFATHVADAAQGWGKHAPYDVIVITGAMPQLPDTYKEYLAPGGRLFAVLGEAPVMKGVIFTQNASSWEHKVVFETTLPMLQNIQINDPFIF